ncbi:MAG: tRNA uridine-5-carboxymethylaminomethyl(34) synthesis GTPase MnmE [Azonexus sp.]|nr:tRNA uridine-5-carboxymethylaminomethyl(34) synthesis GTPase MnmE [Betaproteobacteria bacterium]MBP6034872.1 tRNA uridine-5-carboxymethylaminomethyl(34) synthesis GTPase MnmE [Azonexus sp.]MBP6905578.1 tRNA uridine-5-carboxymethylaminomethyl(34) synthesis GTPase MnmE [Azonexus sp.]
MTRPAPADPIAAVATAPGRGGIGVVRVSGPELLPLVEAVTGLRPAPRRACHARFIDGEGRVIDSGLVLHFPAPHSYTGEDVVEFQGHGGPVVLRLVLARCLDLGARLAQPGEFTRRAFLNGKLDLAQAEAVADLIDASTASAARSAVRSLQGEFSREIHALAEGLTQLRALVEATLDFPDEDIDFLRAADAAGRLAALRTRLARVRARAGQGRLLQAGLQVVLAGPPNVGKSSLLNRLAGDDLALVTPVAGTTRDALRSSIQVEGIPLHIIDTAGLRETDDEVERLGIARAWKEIERADLVLVLRDASTPAGGDEEVLARLPTGVPRITVRNKIDLSGEPPGRREADGGVILSLSARSGAGVDLLHDELLAVAGGQPAEDVFIARERHVRALAAAADHCEAAAACLAAPRPALELFAEDLRLAHKALGEITGETSPDDLLGVIFGRFCIGK